MVEEMTRFNWSEYRTNLSLYIRGFWWLWSRQGDSFIGKTAAGIKYRIKQDGITYKPGWTPLTFCLGIYWWDYGLNVLTGGAVESLSRRFKLLGRDHWGHTGPPLWGSRSAWVKSA